MDGKQDLPTKGGAKVKKRGERDTVGGSVWERREGGSVIDLISSLRKCM